MDSLKSYISMVDARLLHHITGSARQFIHVFQAGHYASEEAFIAKICGTEHKRDHYFHLKRRVIHILQAFAIVSQSCGISTVKKKYDLCQKKFIIGQKFVAKGDREEGIRQINEAYKLAVEYDFVHLACELSSILYYNHLYYHPHKRKAAFYAAQVQKYLEDYVAEKKAEHYFFPIIGKMNNSLKPCDLEEALNGMSQHQGESLKCKTYYAMMMVLHGFHLGDFQKVIINCSDIINVFKGKKGVYSSHFHFFLVNRGKAQMAIGDYRGAENSFTEAENYSPPKSVNEAIIKLYKTLNALHAERYREAYELFRANRQCRFEMVREQFAIIEAYLCFLSKTGYLTLERPFRLGKYLNETFKAQSDKQGSNIAILIAELLVYLGRDRGKFIDRAEAINHYSYRHLTTLDTRRAKRFIKILCLLPRANFNPIALKRLAARHIEYLHTHPIHMGENLYLEILPFETLLDMIMKQLAQKVA